MANLLVNKNGNVSAPTIIMSNKSLEKLGTISYDHTSFEYTKNIGYSEASFVVYKKWIDDMGNEIECQFWDALTDLSVIFIKDYNEYFEAEISLTESEHINKTVTLTSLHVAELSQINAYVEVNTEEDIDRDDYLYPTVFYNPEDASVSLLNRLLDERAPHYTIGSVPTTLRNIQRTFSWSGTSIWDAMNEIETEIGCKFLIEGRTINVVDMMTTCNECGYRGDFLGECPKCGSANVTMPYGKFTNIFVSRENLSEDITLTTEDSEMKNCFRLEAGDEDMTSTVINLNPSGSRYIYYFSDKMKSMISDDLRNALDSYESDYESYRTRSYSLDATHSSAYDNLVTKYNDGEYSAYVYNDENERVLQVNTYKTTDTLTSHENLIAFYYDASDFYGYLESTLMPSVERDIDTAAGQLARIVSYVGDVAISNYDATRTSNETVASSVKMICSAVLTGAFKVSVTCTKTLVDDVYDAEVTVTSYRDDEDVATDTIQVTVSNDYQQSFVQKLQKIMRDILDDSSIYNIIDYDEDDLESFADYLKHYNYNDLDSFENAYSEALSLIEQEENDNLSEIEANYRQKYNLIAAEKSLRESEVEIVENILDDVEELINGIRTALDMNTNYLTTKALQDEFNSYRREDVYENDNFSSEGLSDAELIARAVEFYNLALEEVENATRTVYNISATLHNLLLMPEFESLWEDFDVCNWIAFRVDDKIFRLRILNYNIQFDENSISEIDVEFTTATEGKTASLFGYTQQILDSAKSMATSFPYIKYQTKINKVSVEDINALTALLNAQLTAKNSDISALTSSNIALSGEINALQVENLDVTGRLTAAEADIDTLEADNVTINESLTAQNASISNLQANKADITDLTAATARIGSLETNYVTVTGRLEAVEADIGDLTADNVTINGTLTAHQGVIDNLDTNYAHITNGVIDNATIGYADVDGLDANYAHITNGVIDTATIDQANVNNLSTNYAQINLANVNNAWIDNGVIKDAAISDAQIIGVSANKLTAGTIDASNITVTNLNASNITTGSLTVDGITIDVENNEASIDGAYIEDGTITLNGLSQDVRDTIDGAIETFTGTVVPTLNNSPASSWETDADKSKHVGDVYYVVNSGNAADGYCYRFAYDNTTSSYGWILIKDSDVTAALQRLLDAEGDISNLQTFESETSSWMSDTDDALTAIRTNHTTLEGVVNRTLVSTTQLWFTKADTTAPDQPTSHVSSDSTNGNAWTTAVPSYNSSYPNYFYCYEWEYADGTYGWSSVVRDIGMGETQSTARTASSTASTALSNAATAQSTADANIQSSVQLWFTKNDTTAPNKPSSHVITNDATVYNAWNIAVPTYNSSYPNYYYCYEYLKGDGTYSWSDVIYDRATTENQANARSALTQVSTKVETSTFNELSQTVDENSASITSLSTVITNNGLTESTNISNTVNSVSQTASGNSSKISNLTTLLGTNADGTTASNDIVHQVSEIDQDLDSITTRVGKTEVQLKSQYATSSTAAGTAAKVATITPAISGYELVAGETITVKFINENTTASPTLNVNGTGAKAIKTYANGNLSEAEYKWKAGSTFTFTYNGTNWLMQDSSIAMRITSAESSITQNANNIELKVSESDVTGNYLIGKINLDATTATIAAERVDIAGAAIFNSYSTTAEMEQAIEEAVPTTVAELTDSGNYALTSEIPTNVSELTNDSGYTTATAVANTYGSSIKTETVLYYASNSTTAPSKPTAHVTVSSASQYGKWNITLPTYSATYPYLYTCTELLTVAGNYSWTGVEQSNYTAAISAIKTTADAAAPKTSAVSQEQRVYYKSTSTTAPSAPTSSWISETGTVNEAWTTKRMSYDSSYPYLYTCIQKQTVSGTVACTTVLLDDTTTVIDGGKIITGSVTANQLAANSITTAKLATDAIKSTNYAASGNADSPYSATGTFLDLTNGNIYTPNFGLNNTSGMAYFNGQITASSGQIGTDTVNYWEIGTKTDYNGSDSAALVGHGTSYIQSGDWMISSDRIDTRSYDSSRKYTYLRDSSNYYRDFGLHVPSLTSSNIYDNNFVYVRKSSGTTVPTLESNWEYLFRIDRDGVIYASNLYINNTSIADMITDGVDGGAYLPISGGTISGNLTVTGTISGLKTLSVNGKSYNGTSAVNVGVIGASYGGTGQTSLNASANALLGALDNSTAQSTDFTDNTSIITTDINGSTGTYYHRKSSLLWNYIKSKISSDHSTLDALFVPKTGGEFTGAIIISDNLNADSIQTGDFIATGAGRFTNGLYGDLVGDVTGNLTGTASNSEKVNGHTVNTDVPSGAVFTDTTYTFANGTNGFTVTPAGGTAQTVTVTPSIANASTSGAGLMTSAMVTKLNGITDSADSVSFTRNLTSGTKVGSITINGTSTDLYAPTNTNTTYTLTQDSSDGHKITFTPSSGTATTITIPDNNTTYTFANGTNGFTVTPSGGTAQTVTVTPSIANASGSSAGLMSADDKTTLDNIAANFSGGTITVSNVTASNGLTYAYNSTTGITAITGTYPIPTSTGTSDQVLIANSSGVGVWNSQSSLKIRRLDNKYTSRPSSANFASSETGNSSLEYFLSTSTMTTGKPMGDGHIIHMNWDNTDGWASQLCVPGSRSNSSQWRAQNGGTWTDWFTFLDSKNYNSYSPTLTGTGASGTWGISVSGNAGTATKLASSVTINGTSFDGSSNITTAKWGTARNITIKDSDSTNSGTAVSVDGSDAITLLLPNTIKASLTGNATTATTATKLGTTTVGSTSTPIYLNAGVPTAISAAIPASLGGTGQTTLNASANALINSLSTEASTPTDNDYYVCQYAGGGTTTTTYYRRPVSALYTYIKGKADSEYVNLTGAQTISGAKTFSATTIHSGAVNFANNTLNTVGDDAYFGDQNISGHIAIKGKNGATGIRFIPYSGSTTNDISIDGSGNMTITNNLIQTGTVTIGSHATLAYNSTLDAVVFSFV